MNSTVIMVLISGSVTALLAVFCLIRIRNLEKQTNGLVEKLNDEMRRRGHREGVDEEKAREEAEHE